MKIQTGSLCYPGLQHEWPAWASLVTLSCSLVSGYIGPNPLQVGGNLSERTKTLKSTISIQRIYLLGKMDDLICQILIFDSNIQYNLASQIILFSTLENFLFAAVNFQEDH